jgi:hypothetical protein
VGGIQLRRDKTKIDDLFRAKQERRKRLAKLPIEEKVKILVKLQHIAAPIYLARNIKKRTWDPS